ncbi:hypothetical protein RN001_003495 [Aquatica leii]|uniref:Mutator-like transposase domain-containing protein n=1 Tax=Aquatica leii TaxID=1421715 RepID=A0AAN7Q6D3_9COLE|nr:hypothetical protein RN001_003495 [Aquatica leii]
MTNKDVQIIKLVYRQPNIRLDRQNYGSVPEEHFPELDVKRVTAPVETNMTGNRIVNISFLFDQMEKLFTHKQQCTMGKMKFFKENRNGFHSVFVFKCETCDRKINITYYPVEDSINFDFVWRISSIGAGYSQGEELFSVLNIPYITKKRYKKVNNTCYVLIAGN